MRKLAIILISSALTAVSVFTPAIAQKYPDRTVRIVVGFTPGGPADGIARSIADRLKIKWNQPVVVENMPGASGIVGATAVKRSAPDGYRRRRPNMNWLPDMKENEAYNF